MSTLNYILHIKSWGLYISILLPWHVINHHWDLQHKSVYITQELHSILFSFHWQESETHFISKEKKLHFNYWQSLNKSIIISRMYIYTTTTNCPLATQPPPGGICAHSQIQNWVPKFIEGGREVSKSTKLPNFVFLKWC